jgi:hypothetical protein
MQEIMDYFQIHFIEDGKVSVTRVAKPENAQFI